MATHARARSQQSPPDFSADTPPHADDRRLWRLLAGVLSATSFDVLVESRLRVAA